VRREPDPITLDPTPAGDGAREAPPRCDACGGPFRPDVVWFGEALPQDGWEYAQDAIERCDRVVVVGTSGLVQPAASLPVFARAHGKPVLEINPRPSAITPAVDAFWPVPASSGLTRLLEELGSD
jgi:NAD-dependent deacetylase